MKNKRNLIIIGSIIAVLVFILALYLINLNKKMETYEVVFITDNGDIITTQTVIEGEKAIKPSDPEKEGYAFIEWTYKNKTYDFSKEVTSNLQLRAKWIKIENDVEIFTVKFNSDGGTTIPNQIIEKGNKIEKPNNPTKNGYIFEKWTVNGEEYNFEAEVTENLELKAEWKKEDKKTENSITKDEGKNNNNTNSTNNSNNSKPQEEVSNPVPAPTAPTLSNPAGGMSDGGEIGGELSIVYTGAYATKESWSTISGYELYEKNGNDYKLIHTSEKQFRTDINVDIGESKIYVARVYVYNNAKEKIYSNYSNELKIDNSAPAAPILSSPAGGMSDGGEIGVELNIVYEGEYSYGPHPQLDGVEIYEKNGNNYTLIHTSETTFWTDVTVDIGESKTYVARVYAYNKSKEKIYSNYSNELKIDNSAPAAPTLSIPAGGSDENAFYGEISIVYEGVYAAYEGAYEKPRHPHLSGYELYEKNGNNYTLIHTSETAFWTDVTVTKEESKTYVARVYTYNRSNVKIYSKYSNELVVNY